MARILTEEEYASHPALSNSRLGDIKKIINGIPLSDIKHENLIIGSQFHEAVLENEKYLSKIDTPEYRKYINQVKPIANACRKNAVLDIMLRDKIRIIEQGLLIELEDIEIKIKPDIRVGRVIADPKSTKFETYDEFHEACRSYGYFRQGAIYLDGTGSERFILIGVSKKNLKTFTISLHKNDPRIEEGRAEYKMLIDRYKSDPKLREIKFKAYR